MKRARNFAKLWLRRELLLTLIFTAFILSYFLQGRERLLSEPISAWQNDPKADCGIVLTGGAGRVKEGFDLLARKSIRKLIIAGVYANTSLREILPTLPFYGEIKEEDIFLDRRSGTTYGNAQQSLPVVEAMHCRDIVLVTSSLHMPRAFKTFRASFPEKIFIYKHSIVPGRTEIGFLETSYEVLKTFFYSLWAY